MSRMAEPGPASHARLGVDLGGTKIEAVVMFCGRRVTAATACAHAAPGLRGAPRRRRRTLRSGRGRRATPLAGTAPGDRHARLPIAAGRAHCATATAPCSTVANCRRISACCTGRAVRLANDADCFALSEARDGAAAGANSVLGLILGTGVGGGLLVGGELLRGPNAVAGEWGHNRMPLERVALPPLARKGPRLCYCGRQDCY